jgi:hypothetical protein
MKGCSLRQREVGAAARTRDSLGAVRLAGLGLAGDDAVVAHRCIANCAEFPAANSEGNSLSDRFEMLAEVDYQHFTGLIQSSLTLCVRRLMFSHS